MVLHTFRPIAGQLWASGTVPHAYGKGMVYGGLALAEAQAALKAAPDSEYTQASGRYHPVFLAPSLPEGCRKKNY
jgi:hypothetical protein